MMFRKTLRVPAVVAVLAAGALLEVGAGEARSQVIAVPAYETVYVPSRVKVKVRRPRRAYVVPSVVAPTTYIAPTSTVVSETRYVESVPVVSAPVVERAYIPTTVTRPYLPAGPVVQTQYLQSAPVFEQRAVVTYPY